MLLFHSNLGTKWYYFIVNNWISVFCLHSIYEGLLQLSRESESLISLDFTPSLFRLRMSRKRDLPMSKIPVPSGSRSPKQSISVYFKDKVSKKVKIRTLEIFQRKFKEELSDLRGICPIADDVAITYSWIFQKMQRKGC